MREYQFIDGISCSSCRRPVAIVAAPISALALGFFAFLLSGGRRREGEKYAGLRILR